MKVSNFDRLGLNVALWRALLPGNAFVVSDATPAQGVVGAWWGGPEGVPLRLRPGNRLFLFVTPWGPAYESIVAADVVEMTDAP